MKITCISDLHGYYPKLEGGDLLIIAGDLTSRDEPQQHIEFSEWLDAQTYKKKIVIAGNHDNNIDPDLIECLNSASYLEDSGTSFEGLKIYGSPWTLTFPGINPRCTAFTGTEEELSEKFALIPKDINILITHSPAYGILDQCSNGNVGSKSLADRLFYTASCNLDLHVFGHIHECGGKKERPRTACDKYTAVNCSHVNERYQPVNKSIRIEL